MYSRVWCIILSGIILMNQISNDVIVKKSSYTTYTYKLFHIISRQSKFFWGIGWDRYRPERGSNPTRPRRSRFSVHLQSWKRGRWTTTANVGPNRRQSWVLKTFLILAFYRSQTIKKTVQRYDFQKPNIIG